MKIGTVLLLCFLSVNALALSGKDYLQKINSNYYDLKSYELELNYTLYKGHNGKEIMDEYTSIIRSNGLNSHRKIYHDEIISTSENTVIINHEVKTIQVLPAIETKIFDEDIENSLRFCKDVKSRKTENGTLISINFNEYSSIPYAQIDILIDADFWVKNMTLYYATQLNYSRDYFNPDMDFPRLEIDYSNLKKKWNDSQGLTNLSKYINKEGDNYSPTPLYQNYELIQ